METCGELFYFDGIFYQTNQLGEVLVEHHNSIYEVLRVINSTPLFIEDHYNRFENSFRKIGVGFFPSFDEIKSCLQQLIAKNNIDAGNIRIEYLLSDKNNRLAAFFIPHSYPSAITYKSGVKLVTFPIERPNPEVKQSAVNNLVREKISKLQKATDAYEVLLLNNEGQITEGSKSNVFMVRNGIVYTSPPEQVLKGITRQKTILLANNLGINLLEVPIEINALNSFDACFLTGTSPKILPVNSIDSTAFNPSNEVIVTLINAYNKLISSYCSNYLKA